MGLIYRIIMYVLAVFIWGTFIYPTSDLSPELSFLVFMVGVLYIIGDGNEE